MIFDSHGQKLFVISRPKLGIIPHVGLLLPDDTVVHCTPERGAHRSSVDEFADGQDVHIRWEVPAEIYWTVIQRVSWLERNSRPYDILTFNCYHLVNVLTARSQTAIQPSQAR